MMPAKPAATVRRTLTVLPAPGRREATSAALADADARLKALADPTRLRILNLLASGELCVCDLVELLALPQPTVSRHLGTLRRAGLVLVTREWKLAHYRLAAGGDAVHRAILGCVDAARDAIPELAGERDVARERAQVRRGDPCE